jgi:DNA polymerase
MRTLSIDIETYSPVDLKKSGVYRYVEDPGFTILLFAYAYNDDPVEVIDLTRSELPAGILDDLTNMFVVKTAFNAQFEMVCLEKFTGLIMRPGQWDCTLVRSAMAGLPLSLEQSAKVLRLDIQKDTAGKALLNFFTKPSKPTKKSPGARRMPEEAPDKWQAFIEYCRRDVETERAVREKLHFVKPTDLERQVWALDQKINRLGVAVDVPLATAAVRMWDEHKELLTSQASDLTGIDNPNSVAQLKAWLLDQLQDEDIPSLNKEAITRLLSSTDDPDVTEMLRLRQELGKTSVKKFEKMLDVVCSDGRARGMTQYYGANRTGRWAGRFVQLQNLPQNHLPDLGLARELLLHGDREAMSVVYGNVPATLSELIRTAFIAPEGWTLAVADFSAIEARVIAWLAGEKWRMDVFASHGKIYEASASQMFHVPLESITKGSPLRQRGKVAELALGYQGGVGALTAMDRGGEIPDEEKPGIIERWRRASPEIVRLWGELENAALTAVKEATTITVRKGIKFIGGRGMLFIELPTGRRLSYVRPRIAENRWGRPCLVYEGVDQTKKVWRDNLDTYGGKLTENIVQALARECLAEAMLRLDKQEYQIVMHVHDEAVCQIPQDGSIHAPARCDYTSQGSLEIMCQLMSEPLDWAPGLILKAEGYLTDFYRKD